MTYQMRAYHYIKALFSNVTDWYDVDAVMSAVERTSHFSGFSARVDYGASRIAVIGHDFVIKWDYADDETLDEIGGCETEFQRYKWSLSTGFSYLLAPIFPITYRDRKFYIMPLIHQVGNGAHNYKTIDELTSAEEYTWLRKNVGDLHSFNWGIENGHPVVIDYACPSCCNSTED